MASIQGVYVALFGRPADPTGLAYFNGVTNNGADLSAIGDLAATAEYQDKYKGQNNIQIVTAIYQQLFNRNPEEAGLNFFVNALNNGTLNINNIAIAILDGAQGDDKKVVEAKIASADAFTKAVDTPVEDAAYRGSEAAKAAAAWIATITTTAATADEAAKALKDIVDDNFVGNTITPTAAIVKLDGATGVNTADGVKTTTDKNDTINAGANWVAASSVIDGGLGTDTLNVSIGAATNVEVDSLKNIEIVKVTATANASLNVAEAKQVTEVWNAGSAAFTLGISGIAAGTTLGLTGASTALTTFTFADTTGTSDVANLSVNAATGAGGVTIAGVETLNITNEGTSAIGTVTAAAATAVNLSGKGSLDLSLVADAKTVTNTSTGSVTINLSASEKVATYTGSAAVDVVTTDVAGLLANQTINTGAGNDIINVGAGSADFTLSLTGGAGNDTFNFSAPLSNIVAGTAGDFAKALITITDFDAAQDVIKLAVSSTAKTAFNNVDIGNIDAAADLHGAVSVVAGLAAADEYAIFSFKGDTYIFQQDGATGLGAADGLLKIAGLADASALTASNFIVA